MKIEVLVATMDQNDHSLLDKLNIKTDAIIGNQCNRNEIEDFLYNSCNIKWLSFNERGVGLNRNNTLMRARADICVLADDDEVFYDDYEKIIASAFDKLPQADILIFNIDETTSKRYKNTKIKKINRYNFGRYGAVRLAFKREIVSLNNIFFNLNFGGGTKYRCGEDTLFLKECLEKKLKIYAVPESFAKLTEERKSTWFEGYTDKYFFDKGVLYYFISKKFCSLLALFHCYKHRKNYETYGWRKAYKKICCGIKNMRNK